MKRKTSDAILICLADQAPRIGCGWRRVVILTLGHKWVRLMNASSGKTARMRRSSFNALLATRANREVTL